MYDRNCSRHAGDETQIIVSLGTSGYIQGKWHVRFRHVTKAAYSFGKEERRPAFRWAPLMICNQPAYAKIPCERERSTFATRPCWNDHFFQKFTVPERIHFVWPKSTWKQRHSLLYFTTNIFTSSEKLTAHERKRHFCSPLRVPECSDTTLLYFLSNILTLSETLNAHLTLAKTSRLFHALGHYRFAA